MSDEQKESRISIEDLPQAAEELSTEEAKDVKGGWPLIPAVQKVPAALRALPGAQGGSVESEWKVEEGES